MMKTLYYRSEKNCKDEGEALIVGKLELVG
jgi:hypothetical protein